MGRADRLDKPLALFDMVKGYAVIEPPAQRHSPTSIAAATSVKPDAVTLRERVYRCILTCGPITDDAISATLGMAGNTERPRRVELQRAGRIVASGTKPTASGRQAVAWVVAK